MEVIMASNEIALRDAIEISTSHHLYSQWLDDKNNEPDGVVKDNSPNAIMKRVMAVDLDLNVDGTEGKATVMEAMVLKLTEKALGGDLTAMSMIIKEVQHDGVEKHQYVDKLPDDVKFLFKDVEFTDVTDQPPAAISMDSAPTAPDDVDSEAIADVLDGSSHNNGVDQPNDIETLVSSSKRDISPFYGSGKAVGEKEKDSEDQKYLIDMWD
jgi:hypothetical protein